jgi:hypothetical protein
MANTEISNLFAKISHLVEMATTYHLQRKKTQETQETEIGYKEIDLLKIEELLEKDGYDQKQIAYIITDAKSRFKLDTRFTLNTYGTTSIQEHSKMNTQEVISAFAKCLVSAIQTLNEEVAPAHQIGELPRGGNKRQ